MVMGVLDSTHPADFPEGRMGAEDSSAGEEVARWDGQRSQVGVDALSDDAQALGGAELLDGHVQGLAGHHVGQLGIAEQSLEAGPSVHFGTSAVRVTRNGLTLMLGTVSISWHGVIEGTSST